MSAKGVAACYVAGDQEVLVKEHVMSGDYQLVYFTPETLLDKKKWRRMLLGNVYASRLQAFVVDEAHTVKKWSVVLPVGVGA